MIVLLVISVLINFIGGILFWLNRVENKEIKQHVQYLLEERSWDTARPIHDNEIFFHI